jgi:hypothetical protein
MLQNREKKHDQSKLLDTAFIQGNLAAQDPSLVQPTLPVSNEDKEDDTSTITLPPNNELLVIAQNEFEQRPINAGIFDSAIEIDLEQLGRVFISV